MLIDDILIIGVIAVLGILIMKKPCTPIAKAYTVAGVVFIIYTIYQVLVEL